ncbi:MAG: bifunctional phosphoribosylaminoimidazolecarboxamide formyltransferase/IMP cyclohydrolase [Flavobacteriales bacterium]|jgi:phosphoribosylaminoimidazolecarboxamide formyltransferase/IMP cyclohydrolase|uniref:bifunctional phosphoribosylaminoimidazolecarboxamide formyltransferase/IMP cyclohydrolase n=1 Tax=Blattabacterium sp. (Mastotermes darwiniensis) TaxID=39768 RepID=UPI000231DDD3|nr:bifunctional phosphoribosylaminoimidazolecarboxamide formyltransferase/IMP cyclohydrolase [Blattabacterium sp. (Mastotermes darwiniensis)]AER40519.1 phosphoribosylaminoimidazole carboxamide formyltransferase/IMP cyclohydrolase [Blattabacterium sp. (Mastotermes darwiniensis) str. MADAR]MDR1804966.1 bifunctional phosphoribosylaminoimidazolecarboxamide formyltransferase/IMP cyclohydrolase [Flavobacteriales bacterium]
MKRALISVYEKNIELFEFVSFLDKKGYRIISTGGTYQYLKKHGISNILKIENITSYSEILDGRIKTIHPYIYGGILANRSIDAHMEYLRFHKIHPIDIVLVNFYPFFDKLLKGINPSLIEFIDIGGPSMLRAAAKNFFHVTPITDKNDYLLVKREIDTYGETSLKLRKKLAGKVFNLTSAYDSAISQYFLMEENFPPYLHSSYEKKMNLRYGENPHQKAAYYVSTIHHGAMRNFHQLHGKELSFNNLRDMDIAWKVVSQFYEPACCTVKHTTPCGVALGKNVIEAFKKTYYADSISSFGGIMAFNVSITKELAKEINRIFLEVILAPSYETDVLSILKKNKKNLRIIRIKYPISDQLEYVKIDGGVLVQQVDHFFSYDYKIVTKKKFSEQEIKSLFFAQKVVKYVKSNAIVVAKGTQTLGISGGQTNRLWAARQAIERALEKKKKKLVLVSDAFFPFRDVVDEAAISGEIKAILQPGGSIRDEESVKACDEYGIAMAFTGKRYFKH